MGAVTAPEPGFPGSSPAAGGRPHGDRWTIWRERAAAVPLWLWWTVGLTALMALSAYMRSRYIGHQFWMDEAITTGISLHSLGSIPHILRFDGNPPLYYMLLHVWMSMFGDSSTSSHSLSVLAGVLTIPVAAWGADRMFGRRAAVMAAVLFAFNAWLTAYAQETRMYELVGLEGTIATPAFVLAFIHRRRGFLVLFGVTLTAMLYTHSWGTFFFVGSAIALIPALRASDDRRLFLRDALLTYVIAGICYLPWVPTLLFQVAHTAAPWDTPPRLGAPVQISRNLLGGDQITAVLLFGAVVGFGPLFTRRGRGTREGTMMWTLILLPVAVLGVAWISSQLNPAWAPRYFAPVLASLLFLLAWGCSRARALGWIAIALAVWFLHSPSLFAPRYKSNVREVASEIAPLLHRGDLVVVAQPEQTPLNWYYLPAGLRFSNASNHGQVLADPRYMDWVDALDNLKATQPGPALRRLVGHLRPGQQLLFVRPLTEGAQNWKAPWTMWIRRRAAQWGQQLTGDVSRGILTVVAHAPNTYQDACCVADSAVLYRRTSRG